MDNLNKRQILYTENKCNSCNRCVYTCPIQGANYSKNENGKIIIAVNNDKCIACGQCIDACNMGARQYSDDTERFLGDLKKGEKITILVDPSILLIYGAKTYQLFGYLKEQGVDKIYDVSIGGDISLWGHMKYLIENYDNPDRAFITHTCPTTVNYFEKYRPDMLQYFVPVQSPLICTGIYARKYKQDMNKIAYIGPCVGTLDDISDTNNEGIIDYCVTIRHLLDKLDNVNFEEFNSDYDFVGKFIGRLISVKGSIKDSMSLLFPNDEFFMVMNGISFEKERALEGFTKKDKFRPLLVEYNSCMSGCLFGPCLYHEKNLMSDVFLLSKMIREEIFSNCEDKMSYEDYRMILDQIMMSVGIKYEDFKHEYTGKSIYEQDVSSDTINHIFKKLHKDTPEKRHFDCTACGYPSCYELAKAIALGYGVPENCVHYLNDEITIRYYTDQLTQKANKEGFLKRVNELFEQHPNKHYMIGIVSVNNLNVINDIYGFATGDELIREVADLLADLVGANGVCARLGGGEFFVCFEYSDQLMGYLKEKHLYQFEYGENSFPISMKIGLYDAYERDEELQTMLNLATLTMERIEETSNNVVSMYDDDIRDKVAKEAEVSARMHTALENGEFVPYFQPQYNHRTGMMIGAETLCRWIDESGNMISPGVFIPIFEKNGFIKRLDKYMWEAVFKQVLEWQEGGYDPVPISVNVSRLSVMEDDFADTIKELAEKYPVRREFIHFEITESAYTRQQAKLIQMVNKIRHLGFKIAMDDFGSGYSSLNTLKNVPIDILKLDMGFLSNDNEFKGETIIKNVATMASELKLEMISEGVETKEQADFLTQVGCEVIQGYYYAKPMPLAQFEMRLKGD